MKNIITWPSTTRPIEVAIIVIHAFLIDFLISNLSRRVIFGQIREERV